MAKKNTSQSKPKAAVYYWRIPIRRVWLYCRVASDDTLALEMQERHLREYAHQHRWSVVGVSTDHHNGTTIFRPGLAELGKAVADGKTDTILVLNLSRLCRSMEDATLYGEFLRKHSVDLYSVCEGRLDLLDCEALRKNSAGSDISVAEVKN